MPVWLTAITFAQMTLCMVVIPTDTALTWTHFTFGLLTVVCAVLLIVAGDDALVSPTWRCVARLVAVILVWLNASGM